MADARQQQFDEVFLNLAQQHDGIDGLLHSFFGFLSRRTDFYVTRDGPGPMGFPEGAAETMTLRALRAHPFRAAPPSSAVSPADAAKARQKPTMVEVSQPAPAPTVQEQVAAAAAAAAPPAAPAATPAAVRLTESGKQVPIGNGGVTDRYWFTQTLGETTAYVDVPQGTRSAQLDVVIGARRLRVGLRGQPPIIDGALPEAVRVDESFWGLEDNRTVVLNLDKIKQTWWASLVEGDPEIDTQQVDSTMHVSEYDPETQAAIRKIMFDQKQKALGLPTSDELTADAILERARHLPGSPFLPPEPPAEDDGYGIGGPVLGEDTADQVD